MTFDPGSLSVGTIIGILIGAIANHWFANRRGNTEAERTLWMEAIADTRKFHVAVMKYVADAAKHGVAYVKRRRPRISDYPKEDTRLVGRKTLIVAIEQLYVAYTDPNRRPGWSHADHVWWERVHEDMLRALSDQELRVARGKRPKLLDLKMTNFIWRDGQPDDEGDPFHDLVAPQPGRAVRRRLRRRR